MKAFSRCIGAAIAIAIATAAWQAPARADYAAPGPEAFATTDIPANAGGATGGKLVTPSGAGPYPLLIASHGWSASADNQVGWAEHFASYGFVVVAPSFPNPFSPDTTTDARIVTALVALYSSPSTSSPARGKVDATRVGLEGHSAGGLATTVAALDVKPNAVALFDPVDDNAASGKTALTKCCSPLLAIFAGPSSCNNNAGWSAFKATSPGPHVLFDVVGSTHCDGENNARALCGTFCGGAADPTRQMEYAGRATAFFLWRLKGDATAAATLAQPALAADAKLANVSVVNASTCAIAADAGEGDASAVRDASPSIDASTAGDDAGGSADSATRPPAADAAPPNGDIAGSPAGCGCVAANGSSPAAALSTALLMLALAVRRRR